MPETHGEFFWTGAQGLRVATSSNFATIYEVVSKSVAIESGSYCCSHGITPGTVMLKVQPQATFPFVNGNLKITDGNETLTLMDCRLQDLKVDQDASGQVWTLYLSDRRWRWRDLGFIHGSYNKMDPRGKLMPWTIKSPTELAELCLEKMGETNYEIDLPPGLEGRQFPEGFDQPIPNTTGANPPVDWNGIPPARALQQLAEQYGRRIVYQPDTDAVLIAQLGIGNDLPDGSIRKAGPSVKNPDMPDAIGIIGAPTRYQMRLRLEPVMEDFDGFYRHISQVSYAPRTRIANPQPQIARLNVRLNGVAGPTFQVWLCAPTLQNPFAGTLIEVRFRERANQPTLTDAEMAESIADAINDNPRLNRLVQARIDQNGFATTNWGVIVTARNNDAPFTCITRIRSERGFPILPGAGVIFSNDLVQEATGGREQADWSTTPPWNPNTVQATNRLTQQEAYNLALTSLWRLYRVVNVDVSGTGPIKVPGYPRPLIRRQQIILQDSKVEQIVPTAADLNLRDPRARANDPNAGVVPDFYNGFSKDQPAMIYGSVANECTWAGRLVPLGIAGPMNTNANSRVFVPFQIDPQWQMVRFNAPVYKRLVGNPAGRVGDPELILETGCLILNEDTNHIERFTTIRRLAGVPQGTQPRMERHDDVQVGVIGLYSATAANLVQNAQGLGVQIQQAAGGVVNILTGTTVLEADPILRAKYYLDGMSLQYLRKDAIVVEYNGLRVIDPDGAIQQVTYNIDAGGCSTTASRNMEHNPNVLPYPERRRIEYLSPVVRNGFHPEDMDARGRRNFYESTVPPGTNPYQAV